MPRYTVYTYFLLTRIPVISRCGPRCSPIPGDENEQPWENKPHPAVRHRDRVDLGMSSSRNQGLATSQVSVLGPALPAGIYLPFRHLVAFWTEDNCAGTYGRGLG